MDGEPHEFKVLIHEEELDQIAGWVLEHPDRETGGELCGFWTNARSPSVQFVIGPGPRARHEVAAFFQDGQHQHEALRAVRARHGLQHVGEWHSHHRLGLTEPSGGDAATIANVFNRYPIDEFLLCIATIRGDRHEVHRAGDGTEVRLGAFLFKRGQRGYQRGRWVVLPGASPIARDVRQSARRGGASRPSSAWVVPQTALEQPTSSPQTPAPGWFTRDDGTALLRTFDALCRRRFLDCEMVREGDGVLHYGFRSGAHDWHVCFPPDFPARSATLEAIAGDRAEELPFEPAVLSERSGKILFDRVLTAIAGQSRTHPAAAGPEAPREPSAVSPATAATKLGDAPAASESPIA